MHRSIPTLLTGALLTVPAGAMLPLISVPAAHAAPAAAVRTIKGPAVNMRWGTVQVTIIVSGKKITNVKAVAPTERPRSNYINQQAVPMLRSEALQAQSANIDLISGATMTSEAFAQSLQAAIKAAKI